MFAWPKCCAGNSDKYDVAGNEETAPVSDDGALGLSAAKAKEPLTEAEIGLVEENWKAVKTAFTEEAVGIILFQHILAIAPQAIELFPFKSEFDVQKLESPKFKAHVTKVVATVGVAVDGLRDLEALVPTLQELGLKHSGYGVVSLHYDVVGAALIKTLRDGLGKAFTPPCQLAWTKVYGVLASTMQAGNAMKDDLTAADISVIESTWKQVEGLGAETVGVLLFRNIFEIAPEALGLFSFKDEPNVYESTKLKKHAVGVVNHVGLAVAGVRDLSTVAPALQELGKKHAGYGVVPAHYDVVGQALIKTLQMGLGSAFTMEAEVAWKKVYGVVQKTMLSH